MIKMISNILRSKKRDRGSRSTSSMAWRQLYSPPLIELLSEKLSANEIKYVYSLAFFLATEKNLEDAIEYINVKNYKKLSEMLSRIPLDYDEKAYETYDLVYIIGETNSYFAIVLDTDDRKKNIELKYFTSTSMLDLKVFLGRRLIHPV